jgi:hypothetical protein
MQEEIEEWERREVVCQIHALQAVKKNVDILIGGTT